MARSNLYTLAGTPEPCYRSWALFLPQALAGLASLRSLTLVVNQDDPMARLGLHCLPPSLTSLTLQVRRESRLMGLAEECEGGGGGGGGV